MVFTQDSFSVSFEIVIQLWQSLQVSYMWTENSKTAVGESVFRKTSVFRIAKGLGVPKVFGGHCLIDLIQVTIVCQVPYITSAFEASRVSTCNCYEIKMMVNCSSKL